MRQPDRALQKCTLTVSINREVRGFGSSAVENTLEPPECVIVKVPGHQECVIVQVP